MGFQGSEPAGPLVEPLTRREREVLNLLTEDLTTREIAEKLVISPNSAKWYIQQIYGKLGVNSREEALQRASELGLVASQEALANRSVPKHNLPRQLTRFIGRQREIGQVHNLLDENPLVTLTGSGGVGKTRLSISVGYESLNTFPNGVWFVDLTSLNDPALIPGEILAVLGVRSLGGDVATPSQQNSAELLPVLIQFLGRKSLLLILDNCEHMVEACARVCINMLDSCPELRILATSREALGVPGEEIFHVPSLALPSHEFEDIEEASFLSSFADIESVKLFVERAQSADPQFVLTAQNARTVSQICHRLDGIPLAIELAAVRMKVISVEQIATRMDDLFRLLSGGSRVAFPRHQTLRAMIEWSYNLLSDDEKAVFRRLAVFSGGWCLDAAEAIYAEVRIDSFEILDLLSRLVDKSLVIKEETGGQARYRMLETIRQFAEYQLYTVEGEVEGARERHSDWFLNFAEAAAPQLFSSEQIVWLERLEVEHDNLRVALRWCLERKQGEKTLRLAGALYYFWEVHNHEREGCDWIKQGLDLADTQPELRNSISWAKALVGYGELLFDTRVIFDPGVILNLGDPLFDQLLDIFHRRNDRSGEGQVLRLKGLLEFSQDKWDLAEQWFEKCLPILNDTRDNRLAADTLFKLGWIAKSKGIMLPCACISRKVLISIKPRVIFFYSWSRLSSLL